MTTGMAIAANLNRSTSPAVVGLGSKPRNLGTAPRVLRTAGTILLFLLATTFASAAADWIDLGDEGSTLYLSAEITTPPRGKSLEIVLMTSSGMDRCSVGIDAAGHLRARMYQEEVQGKVIPASAKQSLLLKVVSHAQRPNEMFVHLSTASLDSEPTIWTLSNPHGASAANLAKADLRTDSSPGSVTHVRIANHFADLASTKPIALPLSKQAPFSGSQLDTGDLTPPHPITNPDSALMLDLPGSGKNATLINFRNLPVIAGEHAVVNLGDPDWKFRLHNYLAHFAGRYWCFWSHGPVIEDKATQHLRYATSEDGLHWSEAKVLAGPPKEGFGYIARGFWERDGELLALASLFEAPGYSGGELDLVAFRWDAGKDAWLPAGMIYPNAMNNFAPKLLPSGEWMMSRRATDRSVSLLVGGVKGIDQWEVVPFSTYKLKSGGRPEEPYWWVLPDGHNLVGLFRDNGGSKRLLRSFSVDNGRTWSPMVRSNFPDATSKFNAVHTSEGYYALVSNPNPRGRNPLCLSLSRDGLVFDRMLRLPIPEDIGIEWQLDSRDPSARSETFQYPHVIEHDGHLLIAYSRRKQTVEVVKIPLAEIRKHLAK